MNLARDGVARTPRLAQLPGDRGRRDRRDDPPLPASRAKPGGAARARSRHPAIFADARVRSAASWRQLRNCRGPLAPFGRRRGHRSAAHRSGEPGARRCSTRRPPAGRRSNAARRSTACCMRLPDIAPERRADIALAYLRGAGAGMDAAEAEATWAEVAAILDDGSFASALRAQLAGRNLR